MNKVTYNNKDINAYLLGSLPDAEAEHFDELSFTDDDFADVLKTAEKDLVDAYVQGELSGATLEKFQSYYLASPLRREKVNFANAFQDFAKKSGAVQTATLAQEIPIVIESQPKQSLKGFFSRLNIFNNSRPILQWGFAFAVLALMFFGVWSYVQNSRLQNQINESQAHQIELQQRELELQQREKELQGEVANQRIANSEKEAELLRVREELAQLEKTQDQQRKQIADLAQERNRLTEQERASNQQTPSLPHQISIATFILTPGLRGNNQIQTLSIPAQTDVAAMQLELEPNDYNVYKVILKSQSDNRILWQSGKLKAKIKGENKKLNLQFPAKLLKSNQYSLVVSGISTNGEAEIISNYSFRAVLK